MDDKIADKIRRLLALSESSNPHEAALAASKAQELILKHAVTEERIRASGGQQSAPAEPVGSESFGAYTGKVPEWHTYLVSALKRAFMCDYYYTPGRKIWVVGRPAARRALIDTWGHLVGQIERLADQAWKRESGRAWDQAWNAPSKAGLARRWKRSFCLGAVRTVGERMDADVKRIEAAGTAASLPGAQGSSEHAIEAQQTAIVLHTRQTEVAAYVKTLKLRSAGSSRSETLGSAYQAGKVAGHGLSLKPGKKLGTG